jgi:DTW domain-containing protein YfiP
VRPIFNIESERMRNLCSQCLKSEVFCYCKELKPFRSNVVIALLQHPLERRRTVGTARMAHLTIENSLLIPGIDFDENEEVNRLIADPKNHCVVLYPGRRSLNISTLPQNEIQNAFPKDKTLIIFVIDGTWACAKTMVSRSKNLLKLPQICFTPARASEYQFRRQPKPVCLSTIEAVHQILEILEPEIDSSPLIELFRNMVKKQVTYTKLGVFRRVL